jgi:hypothetical protein
MPKVTVSIPSSLPTFLAEGITQLTQPLPDSTDSECPICLNAYAENATEPIIRIKTCRHVFHKTCLETWVSDHQHCPDLPMQAVQTSVQSQRLYICTRCKSELWPRDSRRLESSSDCLRESRPECSSDPNGTKQPTK